MGISYINWNNLFDTIDEYKTVKVSSLVDPITKTGIFDSQGNLSNVKIQKTVKLDRSSKYYQYGRVPFKVYLSYSADKKDIYLNKIPKLFIIDDMEYTLPPATWSFPRWLVAVIVVVAIA